jgi:hypothetical protein
MRVVLAAICAAVLLAGASIGVASADGNPSNGFASEGRNDAGFGGGPHCHVNEVAGEHGHFDVVPAFPSHTAHEASGLPSDVFAADPDCDGDAG